MKRAQPLGLNRRRVQQLLSQVKPKASAADRIEFLSDYFLGRPYIASPLVGSAEESEVFVVSFDEFDCVTYIETLLALARAANTEDFVRQLQKIRYAGGCVDWFRRNHYMTHWIRNNTRQGAVRRFLTRIPRVSKERVLNVVPGLPPVRTRFECVSKTQMRRLATDLKTGDFIFFASTRPHLDIFHVGVIVRDRDRLLLRHASRSKGSVVEQELSEFVNMNRMAGVIIVRPQEMK